MAYQHIKVPEQGTPITANEDHSLNVPNTPIIPYIEGDGIGIDISPVMIKVVDAAVEKAYGGEKKIAWMEIYTGEKAAELYEVIGFLRKRSMRSNHTSLPLKDL